MKTKQKPVICDREIMTETERELLVRDVTRVISEYFETEKEAHLDITRTDGGYSVCIIVNARRIKKLWRPQD